MAVLTPTAIVGRVAWLGLVRDRAASLRSEAVERVEADFGGFSGESHFGLTRPACSRVAGLHPKGTPIRNSRQVTILSREEMAATAAAMGLPGLEPEWVGANLVLEGLPDLTLLPPSSRLQAEAGATLVVDMENAPCQFPAREIDVEHPGLGAGYRSAARHRRGVTAWVERAGILAVGDTLRLFVPPLRSYPALSASAEGVAVAPIAAGAESP